MSLATLPGAVFAQVVRCLYPQETRQIYDPPSRYADRKGTGECRWSQRDG